MTFLGRLIGYLYLTFYPSTTPKKDFFKHCISATICLSFIPLISLIPSTFQHAVLTLSILLSGISRSYLIIPNMIMLQCFNVNDKNDKIYINFWIALSTMGDVLAIILVSFLMVNGIDWRVCFGFSLSIFIVCSIVLYVCAD